MVRITTRTSTLELGRRREEEKRRADLACTTTKRRGGVHDHNAAEDRHKKGATSGIRIFSPAAGSPEVESCPLDHSGIVAASDRNGGFQLNFYPTVLSGLC